jgi:outer membrane protein assembly factor BamB
MDGLMHRRRFFPAVTFSMGSLATLATSGPWAMGISAADIPNANWPAFRGAGACGWADGYPLPERWQLKWQAAVPGLGHSSPIVWGERVYVATAISDAAEVPLKLGLFGDREAAVENEPQAWVVLCFDKRSGKLEWERTAYRGLARAQRHMKATQANTTLATDGDNLVAFFGSEGLYCYSLDGELRWSKDLGIVNVSKYGVGWGYASSPALHGDRILLQCDAPDNPYLVALDMADGRELWRVSRRGGCERSWSTPYIHQSEQRTQVIANGWPYVISYELATGRELWRLKGGGDNPVPTPFSAHGLIFIANGHGDASPVWAVRPEASGDISLSGSHRSNAAIAWSDPRMGAYLVTPVVYEGLLYGSSNNGILKCYDAQTGKLHYQQRLGSSTTAVAASPVAGDGKVYWTTEEGKVHVLAAGPEYRELAVNDLGEETLASPAISEGVLYFRTRRSLMAVGRS